ncbi:MAG TPA: VCBS domain-containing protein, partial [Rhizobiaceae bacterium]
MSIGSAAGDGPSVAPLTPSPEGGGPVTIADAKILFLGEYSRAGHDLLIEHDGKAVLVQDYFAGGGSNLVGPTGAFLTPEVVEALAGPVAPGQYAQAGSAPPAGAALEIGKVVSVEGTATATRTDGVTVRLADGDPVYQGDVVRTEAGSKLGISFIDDSVFSMSADARMVLDELVFDPAKADDSSMVVNLVQGSFVFVTGQIAPTGNMKVETPVATMGIRGTTPKVLINTDLGVTEFTILPDPGSGKIGSYLLIDKATGEVLGTVESVGDKWVITSLSDEPVKVAKSGLDLLEDERALADIRDAVSNALGKRTEYDGANSFQQVAYDATASKGGEGGPQDGNGSGGPNGGDGGVVDPTPDKDDPPIAGDDAFTTNEDFVLVGGNVINASGGGADVDPDGFALAVTQVNDINLTFSGGTASLVLPANAADQTVGANLLISQNGSFSYDPTSAFNYLAVNEYRIESFTYTITDKFGFTDTATVTIRVDGRNDTPVITVGDVTGSIDDEAEQDPSQSNELLTETGWITFADVDLSDRPTATVSAASATAVGQDGNPLLLTQGQIDAILGAFSISPDDASGANTNNGTVTWTYSINENTIDFLGAEEVVTAVFTIKVDDHHGGTATQTVTITINGANAEGNGLNDAPVITPILVVGAIADVSETAAQNPALSAGSLTANGSITFLDVDLTDRPTATEATKSVVWTAGATELILAPDDKAAIENAFTISPNGASGGNTNAGTVGWTYTLPESAVDFLAEGEKVTVTFTITVTDDEGGADTQDVTITITGANDAPDIVVASGDSATLALTESSENPGQASDGAFTPTGGGTPTYSGTISFSDVDYTDDHTTSVDLAVSQTGSTNAAPASLDLHSLLTLSITQAGADGTGGKVTWTFDGNENNFDYLAEGETAVLTYTVRVTDDATGSLSDTQTVVVTITGANDAPDIVVA